MQSIYQVNTITSAMFQTSMAGNTLVVALALQSLVLVSHGVIGLWLPSCLGTLH
ncbi:MAG: hypothetical protein ACLSXY_04185 [Veillonella sp.]